MAKILVCHQCNTKQPRLWL